MSNFYQGQASFIDSAGRTWRIVMDFHAFAVAARALNVSVDALLGLVTADFDRATGTIVREPHALDVGQLLHAGLQCHHAGITLRDAVNLMGQGAIVGEALMDALLGALTDPETASAEGKAPAPAGAGTKPSKAGRKRA